VLPIAAAAAAIALIAAIARPASHPAIGVGLLWYAIALVPVLGIVPIGPQAMADRYAYLPAVGIYAAIAFGAGDAIARRSRRDRTAAAALAIAVLMALAVVTRAQLAHWRSSEALFRHATEVTRDNAAMHFRLATTLEGRGRMEEALEHYRKAVEIRPDLGLAHYRLASVLMSLKMADAAHAHYREAVRAGVEVANDMIGLLLMSQRKLPEALAHYREAARRNPRSAEARAMLAYVLSATGDLPGALREYRAAAKLASDPLRWSAEIEAVERRMRGEPPR
jgi:tetratricopeptide (TPR) repeat protein